MKGTERFGKGLLDALLGEKPVAPTLELEIAANRLSIVQRTQQVLKAEVDALDGSIEELAREIERLKKDIGQ